MTVLILDTCVWVDLAVAEPTHVATIRRLVEAGKVRLVVPDLVKKEWSCLHANITAQITRQVVHARRAAIELAALVDLGEVNSLCEKIDPEAEGAKLATARIQAVEELLERDDTVHAKVSADSTSLAVEHALSKKAPFRHRNGMADALIFFTAVEWVDNETPDVAVFVSHNKRDFSDDQQSDVIAPDLKPFVEKNGLKYAIVIGRILNEIEQSTATPEQIEREESVVEVRTRDDALARLIEQQKLLERLSSPMIGMDEHHRELLARLSEPLATVNENTRELLERLSMPMARMDEQQRELLARISEPLNSVNENTRELLQKLSEPMLRVDEHQRELLARVSNPLYRASEHQRELLRAISDPISRITDHNRQLREMAIDPFSRMVEQARQPFAQHPRITTPVEEEAITLVRVDEQLDGDEEEDKEEPGP